MSSRIASSSYSTFSQLVAFDFMRRKPVQIESAQSWEIQHIDTSIPTRLHGVLRQNQVAVSLGFLFAKIQVGFALLDTAPLCTFFVGYGLPYSTFYMHCTFQTCIPNIARTCACDVLSLGSPLQRSKRARCAVHVLRWLRSTVHHVLHALHVPNVLSKGTCARTSSAECELLSVAAIGSYR